MMPEGMHKVGMHAGQGSLCSQLSGWSGRVYVLGQLPAA